MSEIDNSREDNPLVHEPGVLGQTQSFDRDELHTKCISADHTFTAGPSIPAGEVLGDYKIIERIGAGGMGVVYKALNMPLERIVALKVLPSAWQEGNAVYRERLAREAKAAARVRHPNVVVVFRTGKIGEHSFIESEYVDGQNLRDLIEQEGRLPPDRAVRILRDAAEGLTAVHQHGLVHRDVKPANILVDAQGRGKIADFGLVRTEGEDSTLTAPGGVLGSPQYMSPEQCEGKVVDLRSDIYSLGVTFYHMLTGRPPFCTGTPLAILRQHTDQEVPSASTIVQDLPAWICAIVERMLAKKPGDRYENCEQLLRDLPIGDPNQPPATPESVLNPAPLRRKRTMHVAGLLIMSLLLAVAVIRLMRGPTPPIPKRPVDAPAPAFQPPVDTAMAAPLPPSPPVCPGMVLIPAGDFLLGEAGDKVCGPAHAVHVGPFYIDEHEVSNAKYKCFVDATEHPPPKHWVGNWVATDKMDHPVVNVSWHDADAYARWARKRLPTEAEWERAAAGRNALPYPWGQLPVAGKANTAEILGESFADWNEWAEWWPKWRSTSEGQQAIANGGNTVRGGSFPEDRSPDGCFDVVGNVYEWTASWLTPYPGGDYDHPNFGETHRVVRGGSWFLNMQSGRAQHRSNHLPTDVSPCIGFRCAKDAPTEMPGQE